MVQETDVQSQVVIPKTQKWYLMPPCLTLNIIRYKVRVEWSNIWNRIVLSPSPRCSSYWKGSFRVTLDQGHQLYFLLVFLSVSLNLIIAFDKMKRSFFQAAVTSILLYECTTWTLTKRHEKKLDGNYTRMLRAILNKSWRQHPTRHQLYGHLPPIVKTIQVRPTRHARHSWRSRDELISDVLLWIPTHGRSKAGRPARTYIQQLCEDTGCCPEDLSGAMNDREEWRERVRDIRATSVTWWWWWIACEILVLDTSDWSHITANKWYYWTGIVTFDYVIIIIIMLCH